MRRLLKITAIGLGVALVLLVAVVWALLEARVFNSWRSQLLAESLSIQTGRPVEVGGEVRVALGLPIRISVTDVRMPSEQFPDVDLAALEQLTLESNPTELLRGKLDFDRLNVSGLTVRLVRTGERNTWSQTGPGASSTPADEDGDATTAFDSETYGEAGYLLNFVLLRSEAFNSVRIEFEDRETGFTFDFNLEEMKLEKVDDAQRLLVTSTGTVNDTSFEFSGDYAHVGPFTTKATVGGMSLSFDGSSDLTEEGRSFAARLLFDAGEVGDMLDALKLQRVLEGSATLSADVRRTPDRLELSDIATDLAFRDGPRISASGRIGDFERLDDVNIEAGLDLYRDGQAPPPARRISEIRVLGGKATIVAEEGEVFVDDLRTYTNIVDLELREIGPISIGRVFRTEDGRLSLSDVSVQAGPQDAPFLSARGDIGDLLQRKDFELHGTIAASARLLLTALAADKLERFGGVEADFSADDSVGYPRLTQLEARSVGSDLWMFNGRAASGVDDTAKSLEMDVVLEVPDGAAFLGGLGQKEVDIAPVGLAVAARADTNGLSGEFDLTAGRSKLSTSLDLTRKIGRTTLDGRISSPAVYLADLQRAVAWLIALNDFLDTASQASRDADAETSAEVQPLVLPRNEVSLSELLAQEGVQPLVLPREEVTLESLLAEDGVEPLILQGQPATLKEMLDLKTLVLDSDVDIQISIASLSGVQGVTSISSELVASGGRAQLGPIDVRYGGGFLRAEASMDLVNSPDLVRLSGSTGGWDVGKILEGIGQEIPATGVLNGSFDLTGSQKSARAFLDTMRGTVSLRLSRGAIATSLIELAGLGILPWLFSEERRQKYTRIDCLAAPLRFDAGTVSLDNTVIETQKVQLVARGKIDWIRDTVSLLAEPRMIGRPLSRSPWPFTISGRLSDPRFKLLFGGVLARRADGASTMPAERTPCVPDILQLQ